jgi:uncharacterized protein YkwD
MKFFNKAFGQTNLVRGSHGAAAASLYMALLAPTGHALANTGSAPAEAVQAQVLALVNQARAQPRMCGAAPFGATRPLRLNTALQDVSATHAADMARYGYFEHTGRDGSRVSDRASRAGYAWRAIGENIASGHMTAAVVVQGWLKSPGHCANIMSTGFSEMGAAFAVNPKSHAGIYWVQVFGTAQ